jgi:hypothetical protein
VGKRQVRMKNSPIKTLRKMRVIMKMMRGITTILILMMT